MSADGRDRGRGAAGSGGGSRLDAAVARARREHEARVHGYRERALRLLPWVCGRCGREFTRETVRELTVHHRDHDHDNNPADGSNWELLCVYCHENEHARLIDGTTGADPAGKHDDAATSRPFEGLRDLLKRDEE